MDNRYDYTEYNQLHRASLHEEAARERLANEVNREPGLVRKTLNALFGGK